MAIANVASNNTGNHANSTTSLAVATPGNVTANNLVIAVAMLYKPSSDPIISGDLTKTAGTSTLGTISLDNSPPNFAYNADSNFALVGIWSMLVTGTGSLTLTIGGAPAASFLLLAIAEFSGNWSTLGTGRAQSTANGTDATDGLASAFTSNLTSNGDALMIGGLSIGATGTITITPDAAFTQVFEDESGSTDAVGSCIFRIVTGSVTDRAEWTTTTAGNQGYAASMVVYQEKGPSWWWRKGQRKNRARPTTMRKREESGLFVPVSDGIRWPRELPPLDVPMLRKRKSVGVLPNLLSA